jgi:hypothetical protein
MERRTIERITKWVTGLALPLILVAYLLGGSDAAIGAAAGALLAVANWMGLRWLVTKMIVAGDRARAILTLLLVAKMGAVLGIAALLLQYVDAMGFTIGMGALVLGVVIGAVQGHLDGENDDGELAEGSSEKD